MESFLGCYNEKNYADREETLKKVEMVCLEVVLSIARGEFPKLRFCNRASWDNVSFSENGAVNLPEVKKMVQIRLDSKRSIKTFAFMMKVLSIIYRLLQENKYCTKRDIYYQYPGLFGSQSVVDNLIDNIACMLEVPRWKLHVLATCKGLVAGNLQFYDEYGHHIDCNKTKMGVQIPAHEKDMLYMHSGARFVLIVEKDATFQKLLTDNLCENFFAKIIIITGKGFPDIGTRLLVHKLWETFHLPTFALMDADPHGIAIMLVYKYGSKAQAFENHHLAVPAIKWLGILPTDIPRYSFQVIVSGSLRPAGFSQISY
ncbi:meiotic recombination protein SPO11-like isoform X2 [Pomacea canaliculata]|uniref:meiotic recombination protein SPO11-like isoform X2 n=1 Tax=Pomacea canaliculata TaxID=400727 RepID=UPI000D73B82C|nr:meiotic recombination protein SPO11-like isoform X2 [Pomacea canaliculata]